MGAPEPGTRVLARGETWTVVSCVPHADCDAIRLAGASSLRTLLLPFDRITPLTASTTSRRVRPRAWARGVLRLIAGARPFGCLASAAGAEIDIHPYQLEPALAMLRHACTRILIADAVGLGKTIQAGLIVNELAAQSDEARVLLLVPAGLREQWRRELRTRFGIEALDADAAWVVARARELPPDVNPWTLPGIFVASIDLVKRAEVLRSLEEAAWDLLVVDEAHGCGLGTARLAAAHAIALRSRRVILMTATPPDGDPPQLAALLRIGALEDDIVQFRRSRVDAGLAVSRRSTLLQVRPSAAERRMHRLLERYTSMVWAEAGARLDARARLAAVVLRKRALSSAWSLAASVRRRADLLVRGTPVLESEWQPMLPLGDEDPPEDHVPDAVLGAAGLNDAAREQALLEQIHKAALQACRRESKLCFLLRLLRRTREPAIVFTEYRDTLAHLERELRGAGHPPVVLHGGMLPRERADVQRAFGECDAVLLATDAASEGLNLQARCRTVIHFELPWTPARLEQRTGRVDRFGQHRRVHEILLVARHTAERFVLAPLIRRARTACGAREAVPGAATALTESSVAAAVMEERAIEWPAGAEPARMLDLRHDARHEADRILRERRLRTPRGARRPQELLICPVRYRAETSLHVFEARLEDGAGRLLHSSLVALRAPTDSAHRPHIESVAAALAGEAMAIAFERHDHVSRALRERDRAMLRIVPSAAHALVQLGLFDRRGVRTLEHHHRTLAMLEAAVEDRDRTAELPVQKTIRLVAVR